MKQIILLFVTIGIYGNIYAQKEVVLTFNILDDQLCIQKYTASPLVPGGENISVCRITLNGEDDAFLKFYDGTTFYTALMEYMNPHIEEDYFHPMENLPINLVLRKRKRDEEHFRLFTTKDQILALYHEHKFMSARYPWEYKNEPKEISDKIKYYYAGNKKNPFIEYSRNTGKGAYVGGDNNVQGDVTEPWLGNITLISNSTRWWSNTDIVAVDIHFDINENRTINERYFTVLLDFEGLHSIEFYENGRIKRIIKKGNIKYYYRNGNIRFEGTIGPLIGTLYSVNGSILGRLKKDTTGYVYFQRNS